MSFHEIVSPSTDNSSKSAYLPRERLPEKFVAAGIQLEYKSYQCRDCPQLLGAFEPAVTISGLLFSCDEHSREYLRSLRENEKYTQLLKLHMNG